MILRDRIKIGSTINLNAPGTAATDTENIEDAVIYAIEVNVTKVVSVSGNVKLQTSLNGSTWFDESGSTEAFMDDFNFLYKIANEPAKFVRAFFTNVSGEFNADVFITIKPETVAPTSNQV